LRRLQPPRTERGITLTELTIVMVLAALVTVGIVTFYLNSQSLWLDASTQAMTQRDATLVLEAITADARPAAGAIVLADPDTLHQTLVLYEDPGKTVERSRFAWNAEDSLIHYFSGPATTARGPLASSKVLRFQLETNDTLVTVRELWMYSSTGQPVEIASTVVMNNR
jgi:Tfp pilus assembly protein PilW